MQSNITDFYSGDSLNYTVTSEEYSSLNGYSLTVRLLNATNPNVEWLFLSDLVENKYTLIKTNTETATIQAGTYRLFYVFSKSSENFVKQIDGGLIKVSPNVLDNIAYDIRSETEKQLDAVRNLKNGILVDGVQSMSIEGKSITLMSYAELVKEEVRLEKKLAKELRLNELKEKGRTNRNKLSIRYVGIK